MTSGFQPPSLTTQAYTILQFLTTYAAVVSARGSFLYEYRSIFVCPVDIE